MLQLHFPEDVLVACCRASRQLAVRPAFLHFCCSTRLPEISLQLRLARAQLVVFPDGSHRVAFRPEHIRHFRITNSTYPAELEEIRDVFVITTVEHREAHDVLCAWTFCHLFAFDTFDDTPTATETRRFHQCFQRGGMPVDCDCDPPHEFV